MLDRIVPVHRTDLISLYYAAFAIAGSAPTKIIAIAPGEFEVEAAGLCVEPVKKAKITATSGVIYFVPAYDFEGFTNGSDAKVEIAGADVDPDGVSLYSLTISSGTYTAAKITM